MRFFYSKLTLSVAFLLILFMVSVFAPTAAQAQQGGCVRPGQCINGKLCDCLDGMGCFPSNQTCTVDDPTSITGTVTPPQGVAEYNSLAGGIGILSFASKIIFLLNVGAGFFAMYNFLTAGLMYVTGAGDSGAHTKVKDKLTFTFVGIALIVSTYTLGGLIGLIFYGDASFLLNPQLQGALEN